MVSCLTIWYSELCAKTSVTVEVKYLKTNIVNMRLNQFNTTMISTYLYHRGLLCILHILYATNLKAIKLHTFSKRSVDLGHYKDCSVCCS